MVERRIGVTRERFAVSNRLSDSISHYPREKESCRKPKQHTEQVKVACVEPDATIMKEMTNYSAR